MKTIENLIVCGDSFQDFGEWPKYKGTHWSEIVADRLNVKLVNLAIKGGSSVAVAFQMLYAEQLPNSFVVGSLAASETRFEISKQLDSSILNTIENFIFEPTKKDPWNNKNNGIQHIRSTPLKDIDPLFRDQILTNFNLNLKRQTDIWSILYALRRLSFNNIPFLFFQSVAKDKPIPLENFMPFVNEDSIIKHDDFDLFAEIYDHDLMTLDEITRLDPGYHTTVERQTVIADYMIERILKALR